MTDPQILLSEVNRIIKLREQADQNMRKTLSQAIGITAPSETATMIPAYYTGYREAVEWLEQTKVHAIKGVFPDALFRKVAPNQTPTELEYVKENFKQTTLYVFKQFVETYGRAYHENNWSISFPDEAEELASRDLTFQQYVNEQLPEYGNLDYFTFNYLPALKLMDAEGVVAIMPHELPVIEREGEMVLDPDVLIKPYPQFFHIDRVVYKSDSLCIILSDEKSVVEYNSKKVQEGLVFWAFDKEWIYRIEQTGKKIDNTFVTINYFEHGTEMLPVKTVMGVPVQVDGKQVYQSPFLYAVDTLDEVLLDASLLRGIKPTCAFPYRIMIGDPCEFQITIDGETLTCDDGYHYSHDGIKRTCQNCGGRGTKDRVSPLGTLLIKPPKGTSQGDQISPDKAMFYASPSPEMPKLLRDEINYNERKAMDILHLKSSNPQATTGDITATESRGDQKALIAGIKDNCVQLFDIYEWELTVIGRMRYGVNFQMPTITRPTNYDFYLEADYMNQVNDAIKSGQPPFVIQSIIYKYLQTIFYSDVMGQRIFNLISQTDRLMIMTSDDINLKLSKGLIDKWEAVLHDSAIVFVNQLIQENEGFLDLDFEEQKRLLIEKAKASVPVSVTSAPFNPQQAVNDILNA